jgi:SAM-dependent methyltransferase
MIKKIKKRIEKEQFHPSWLGVFVNPFFIARNGLRKSIDKLGKEISGKTLDAGCGTKPYENLFASSEYVGLEFNTGLDLEKKKADFYYDGKTFPFADEEFDSVVTNQVLEHVFNPKEFLSEINRVLKLNGKLLLTVPFVWDEHEQPYDYARYSSFGLKSLLEETGFEILLQLKSVNNIAVIFQLLNGYIYEMTRKIPVIKQASVIFIMAPITLTGLLLSLILPSNNDLYLDNIILASRNDPDCCREKKTDV